jgi:hypothetical protein
LISMPDINKKEAFKLAIREFHERSLPDLVEMELSVPLDADKKLDSTRFVPLWEWLPSRDFF